MNNKEERNKIERGRLELEKIKLEIEYRKKSRIFASFLNFILPGSGYIYCKKYILGFLVVVLTVIIYFSAFIIPLIAIILPIWGLLLTIDGFLCAEKYNRGLYALFFKKNKYLFPAETTEESNWHLKDIQNILIGFFASALLLTLIQPPFGLSFLAWIAYVPFILIALSNRKPAHIILLSYIVALIYWLTNIYWIGYVTISGWIAYCSYMALLWPALAMTIRAARKYKVPLLLAVPVLIVGVENLQGFLLGGFYWRHLSHSQYANITLIQIADIFGAAGISFLVAMVNALFADLILTAKVHKKRIIVKAVIVLLVLSATIFYGRFRIAQSSKTFEEGPVAAAVQSNLPQSIKNSDLFEVNLEVFQQLIHLSEKAKNDGALLVVWPETIVPAILDKGVWPFLIEPKDNLFFHGALCEFASEGIYLLVGSPGGEIRFESDDTVHLDRYNSVFLYEPSGEQARDKYNKIHLVPFGEVMPFKESFPPLYKFLMLFNPYDFDYNLEPGNKFTVFELNDDSGNKQYQFGVMICYESTIPEIARGFTLDEQGAKRIDWLVNISNDGWFVKFTDGKVRPSTELSQHTTASVFRAVENRISILRSVNTGISCLIDPLGRIQDGYLGGNLPSEAMRRTGVEGYFADRIVIDKTVTVFSRFGSVLDKACVIVVGGALILLILAPVIRNSKKRFTVNGTQKKSK